VATRSNRRATHARGGQLLRTWRERRKLSQLGLAMGAGVSARHLSFIETGRAKPSAELILLLTDYMTLPLRERNEILLRCGYAPRYPETGLAAPALQNVRRALQRLLDAHQPYPGIAVDRGFNVVLSNDAARDLVAMLPAKLRAPSVNMLRASLHPEGFAAATANFAQWGAHVVKHLCHLAALDYDPDLTRLRDEVLQYPNVKALQATGAAEKDDGADLLIPCVLSLQGQQVSMFTTLAKVGSSLDITLDELTLELFYPADRDAEAFFRRERPD
jgi:transcriptional regulator with XRE-family HTH domain